MTREKAIEILQALKFIVDFENYSDRVEIAIGMGIEALKEQRPHGEWVEKTGMRPPEDKGVKFCSNCMNKQPRDYITHKPIEPNFCPNCGADMREGDNK